MSKYQESRNNNIKFVTDKGLEILSIWDGRRAIGAKCMPLPVTVRNTKCGHTFTSTAVNLLSRGITCSVCGKAERTKSINAWSKANSAEWQKTATEWQQYKSHVTRLTRKAYKQYKHLINPTDLLTGTAGYDGVYHLDHIVAVRYCFDHSIPAELCAHHTNLQMLDWRSNVVARNHLKEHIPEILQPYIRSNQ